MTRRIALLTGTRAEWHLLEPLARRLHADPRCELRIVVTGMHLAPAFGRTVDAVRASGLPIAAEVPGLVDGDDALAATQSVALAGMNLAAVFARLRPDCLVVLGDRGEAFAAAWAAYLQRIPVAHLHGGESTAGAVDDGLRHAISKLAALHFPAAEPYAERLRAMGEPAERVHLVGAPGLDAIAAHRPRPRAAVLAGLGLRDARPLVLLTFHPVTQAGEAASLAQAEAVAEGVRRAAPGALIVTAPNADAGGRALVPVSERLVAGHGNACLRASLGAVYLDVLACADAMVGNSSSGILEAPSFRLPVVDVGDRQGGRLRHANVLGCAPTADAVASALARALDPAFRAGLAGLVSAFGDGRAAERIAAVLLDRPLPSPVKPFADGPAYAAAVARCGLREGDA